MAKQNKPDEARKKLKRFLQEGHPDDVASVLVHTLMQRADVAAQMKIELEKEKQKKKD